MSSRVKVLVGVVVVAVAVAAGGLYWFLQDDAPDAVSLDRAVESVTTTTAGDGSGTATTAGAGESTGAGGVAGTWTVDSTTGEFDYESATGTFAGFRIAEQLANIGSATAVGRTGDVTGSIEIDGTVLRAATFEVDLTSITTNQSRRDSRVQDALETGQFPSATFTLTEPLDLGPAATAGDPVSVTAVGDLTVHGVTNAVEIPIDAQLVDDTIVVVGSTDLTFSDYGVTVPRSRIVLSVEDHGTLEMQILLTRG